MKSGSDDKTKAVRDDTIQACNELVLKSRVPSSVSYLKYDANTMQGAVKHQDVDAVFCTALLYIQDTCTGRLHIENTDLLEFFLPGDVVFIDPRRIHEITKCARDHVRKVLVFTI